MKAIQYEPGASGPLTPEQVFHLAFHRELLSRVGPRMVDLDMAGEQLRLAYSDAEYTPGRQPRLGGVFFDGRGGKPRGFTALITAEQEAQ